MNLKKITNFIYYIYKRNNWIFDLPCCFKNFRNIKINQPIFLLSIQGGGSTLISRILRRNKDIVSVTGNNYYWYGADEMQNVLWPLLPSQLSGIKHKFPSRKKFIKPRGWLYATDELIDDYRNTEKDATPILEKKLKKIIRWQIARHAINPKKARFTDKSQVFSVKVSFINKLLKEANPKFILITRNPYAVCYRSVNKKGEAPELKKAIEKFGYNKTLDLAAQHWKNSIKYAMLDGQRMKNFMIIRFEDFLKDPETNLKKICKFCNLDYDINMLPQKHHKISLGKRWTSEKKWYPLRKNLNQSYLSKIKKYEIDIIDKQCSKYAKKLNYHKPICNN
jgi:hypothetical protein